jgi:molecular chaperone DnaK
MSEVVCGIDLGTTNSCLALLRDGRPEPVIIEEGSAIVPSIVSRDDTTGRIIVGREALNRFAAFPHHTVRSIKRLMGKDTAVYLGDQAYSPEQVSSFILHYLVEQGAAVIGSEIRRVVITVPAYFNDAQRRATIKAGELAGLEVIRIINEPTAASLLYETVEDEDTGNEAETPYILVYDLGGGTFDVSILEVKGEIKEVLASCGDSALGGDDFDERLIAFLLRQIREKYGHDFSDDGDRALHTRLKAVAEQTKITLSDAPYARISEVAVTMVNGEPVNLDLEIARREYEEMITDLVEQTMEKVGEALKEAHLEPDDIGRIILVGGSTRTPLVQERLEQLFERTVSFSIDPDLCVALGASVQHGLITGESVGHILIDVTAHSLGMKTSDSYDPETDDADYFSTIIRRNTAIPARKAEVYFTNFDNQERAEVEVFQGESESCRENTLIGAFTYPLKPAPARSSVVAEFAYDKEGLIHIVLEQKGYDNRKEVTLDIRTNQVTERDDVAADAKIVNYMVSKGRRLVQRSDASLKMRDDLAVLLDEYVAVLESGADDETIDSLEERLLDLMDEIEEVAAGNE